MKNNSLFIMHENGDEKRVLLHSTEEIEEAVADELGLPRLPVRKAADILLLKGIELFATRP